MEPPISVKVVRMLQNARDPQPPRLLDRVR